MITPRGSISNEELDGARALLLRRLRVEGVADPDVLRALRVVPRHLLVPHYLIAASYQDRALPIGSEQTISQPTIVGLMSQWAIEGMQPEQRRRVLEIGTGSGYQAAVLAELFDEVYTIEVRPELAEQAQRTLSQLGPRAERIHCVVGDGTLGFPSAAPFDAIMVTAAAKRIPAAFVEQLRPAGRLVLPLVVESEQQRLHVFRRVVNGSDQPLETVRTLPVLFVPLVDTAGDMPSRETSTSS
jgi:protein-L-isoaspartate(D-aspartate) O-methyltransferase